MGRTVKRSVHRASAFVGVVGFCAAAGLIVYYRYFYIRHFRVVQENAVYRSGQPKRGDLARLRDTYGVRTIVNLRRADEQDGSKGPSLAEERLEAEQLGLRFIHLPMHGDATVDPNIVDRWLDVARDEANHPILVHCKAGIDRTGLLAAAYRIRVQGWTAQTALDEAVREGIDPLNDQNLVRYILACGGSHK
ncbi:MAG: tyrosine-protein phosphatase [Phycisphaerae bacterium]|nr:tyrosine-protein phosphatase [Phycisphaerae bacterium]